jgi:DNA-binding MarR family transcriptional regulator
MTATASGVRPEELAQTLFDVIAQFCLAAPRGRRQSGALKEIEFLALSLLRSRDTVIVGELQRSLGILPAQMSRVIRSLEGRTEPLIACRINSRDKRKIDLALTPAGLRAWQDYQDARLRHIGVLLSRLSEEDLFDLHRLLEKARELLRTPLE